MLDDDRELRDILRTIRSADPTTDADITAIEQIAAALLQRAPGLSWRSALVIVVDAFGLGWRSSAAWHEVPAPQPPLITPSDIG